jgi:hypothetical protein
VPRRCIFCGGKVKTDEHVWPDWLNRFIPSDTGYWTESGWDTGSDVTPRRQYGTKKFTLTVSNLCYECNHGWMGDIERPASRLLKRIIVGRHQTLTRGEQEEIAKWAVLRALVFECIYPKDVRTVDDDEYTAFYEQKAPLPGTSVSLGRGIKTARHDLWHRSAKTFPPSSKRAKEPPLFDAAHNSIIQIDELVAHVIRVRADYDVTVTPGADMSEFIKLIWPISESLVSWPPPLPITKDTLRRMTNLWIRRPEPPA